MQRFALMFIGALASAQATKPAPSGSAPRAPAEPEIIGEISGLRNDTGAVLCSIFAEPGQGYPADSAKAAGLAHSAIKDKRATCSFKGMRPGKYAIAFIHDENNNHVLDKSKLGIPIEGYGASRDARQPFGPPKFQDAVFDFSGQVLRLEMRTQY